MRKLLLLAALVASLNLASKACAQVPPEFPIGAGGMMSCASGHPQPLVEPSITPGSVAWVALMIHESAHVVQAYRNGGCAQYDARLLRDDATRDHAFRLQTEVEAYCTERAAGFYRGDGSLRHVALILADAPLYEQWGWSEDDAMRVLERVCGEDA